MSRNLKKGSRWLRDTENKLDVTKSHIISVVSSR